MSDDPSVYTVKEIRLGLFRIYWNHSEKLLEIKNPISKKFELCGSQLGRAVTISFEELDLYDIRVDVKAVDMKSNVVDEKSIAGKEPAQKVRKLNESPISEESKTTDIKSVMQPVKIWLESTVNGSPIEVIEFARWDFHDCGSITRQEYCEEYKYTWKGFIDVKHRYEKDEECSFVVWIDFGTREIKHTNMINTLAEMLHNQTCCDVKFQFKDGQSIGAHIIILSAGSPVFAAMFQSGLKESQSREVDIEDFDIQVFKQLLDYLYTRQVPQIMDKEIQIMLLYEAADKYDVKDLRKECYEMLMEVELDDENAIDLLVWSKFHSISELFENAKNFTLKNCKKLCSKPAWLDLIKKQPELCLEINKKMADLVGTYQYLSTVY